LEKHWEQLRGPQGPLGTALWEMVQHAWLDWERNWAWKWALHLGLALGVLLGTALGMELLDAALGEALGQTVSMAEGNAAGRFRRELQLVKHWDQYWA